MTTTATTTDPTPDTSGVPAPGTYTIDPSHTHVGFSVKHFGLARTRGEFRSVEGTVTIAEDLTASSASAEIEAASFHTGDENRDNHVRSADFLDVDVHPVLTYRSTGLRNDDGDWVLDGELTVAGTTRAVSLAVEFEGQTVDPYGNHRVAFSASGEIDRRDFGLTWSQSLDTGGLVVGNLVRISIDVEAIRPV